MADVNPLEAIEAIKALSRAAERVVAAGDITASCDAVASLVNHQSELKASIEQLKVEKDASIKAIADAKAVLEDLNAKVEAQRAASVNLDGKITQLKGQLAAISSSIASAVA